MVINPDALLIFKGREEEEVEAKPKKTASKKAAEEPMLPAEEKEMMLDRFHPPKRTAPPREEEPIMAAEPEPTTYAQKQKASEEKEAPHLKEEEQVQPKSDINLLKYDVFRPKLEEPSYTSVYSGQQVTPTDYGPSVKVFAEREYKAVRGTMKKDEGGLSREAAKNLHCVWHPWRESYAICSYCHRPFCFEDTIEFNRTYYCLEDIDNVSANYNQRLSASGNNIRILAGIILIFSFLTFFYFANAQVFYVLNYISKSGLPYFVAHINSSYAFALFESVLVLMALFNGLLLFGNSIKSIYLGVIVCLSNVALFTYQYTSTGTFYLGLVATMVFVSLMTLLYSRTAAINQQTVLSTRSVMESNMMKWPNVSRF